MRGSFFLFSYVLSFLSHIHINDDGGSARENGLQVVAFDNISVSGLVDDAKKVVRVVEKCHQNVG